MNRLQSGAYHYFTWRRKKFLPPCWLLRASLFRVNEFPVIFTAPRAPPPSKTTEFGRPWGETHQMPRRSTSDFELSGNSGLRPVRSGLRPAPPKFNGLGTIGGYHSIALFCLGNHIASTPLGFADVGAASVGMVATMRVTIGTMGIKAPAVSRIGCESWNRTRARRSPL